MHALVPKLSDQKLRRRKVLDPLVCADVCSCNVLLFLDLILLVVLGSPYIKKPKSKLFCVVFAKRKIHSFFTKKIVDEEESVKDKIERAKAIQAIANDEEDYDGSEFLPAQFRSSTKSRKKDSNETIKKKVKISKASHRPYEIKSEILALKHSSSIKFCQRFCIF